MLLKHIGTLMPPQEQMAKVTAICWSANNKRLAVVTVDRIVRLYNEKAEQQDKFSTKPAEAKGPKNYIVCAMEFSPDSSKLAIAQSDNIVFVYKLGIEWGDKKSICNKFLQSSPITCMAWPVSRPNEIVYGLAEGKVKVGQLRSNKPATLYSTDSYVAAVTSSIDGSGVVSAHLDGSIHRLFFHQAGAGVVDTKIAQHPCVPYALAWGHSIAVAGNDCQVIFYTDAGAVERTFDYSSAASKDKDAKEKEKEVKCKEFTCAVSNPTGESIVLGNFDSFYTYSFNHRLEAWEEVGVKYIENLYTITSLAWKADGTRLAVGGLCGTLDLYDACIRRYRYKGKFEFTYSSLSQVIVKRLSSGSRIVLKSLYGCEITKINIFQDRYVVANTTDHTTASETLLLGDLETFKLSEIQWHAGGQEKFVFDNAAVCAVFHAGELSLVEYGSNEVLGSVRTENISGHLLSVRINERPPRSQPDDPGTPRVDDAAGENKKIAYLLDAQTVTIKDLVSGSSATVSHDSKVDWLELNGRANMLLFRDKRRQLHLFNIDTQTRTTLLNYCTYVQWVPSSDVVVAQNRANLCVWYNIHTPDQVTVHQIKGDIEDIERRGGQTEVIVDEGISTASYLLDEALIEFGTAIDDRAYGRATDILETLELSPEAEGMWQQLSEMALAHGDLRIAERCAAALGDVSCLRYLHRVNKIATANEAGQNYWDVRSRMALLKKDVRAAEDLLLQQGKTREAIEMHRMLRNYDEAIQVAESRGDDQAAQMRQQFYQYLLDTRQEEQAARLKEEEGDHIQAINLYLKGGLPAMAANVIKKHNINNPPSLLEGVATALTSAGLHDRAGEFYERMDQLQRALDAYIKGNAYRKAVELARRAFPGQVVQLQEMWGDHLVSAKQVDMAINHYIEANAYPKAIEAALGSRQWVKAAQMVENLDTDTAKPFYRRLARHYEEAQQYDEAERYWVEAQATNLAVEMYTKANQWERAHKLASSYMSEREVGMLYIAQAQKLEAQGKLKDAERLYLTINEADLAINMYKKARKYDAMVRLVATHRKELLKETHQFLAQHLEAEGNLRDAEHHYCEAGEWLSAVNMYRSNDMWEEAIRVAKLCGGPNASKRVAYAWALALGGDAGAKLLTKLGLIEPAIDYAIESGAFDHAFELARSSCQAKLPEIHLKHALYLEDEERYKDAEAEFINASKPREAIDMYVHQQAWADAMRVADTYDPSAVPDVYAAQARAAADARDYARAEELFLLGSKPELALAMYQEAAMWPEALALTQRHLPHKLAEVSVAYSQAQAQQGTGGSKADFLSAGRMWEQSKQWSQAIDAYLNARREVLPSADDLEEVLDCAVTVARRYVPKRYPEVVAEVTRRLREVGRHATAAEMLREADELEAAVACAMEGEAWTKARELAQGHRVLEERVEAAYRGALQQASDTDGLLEMGHTSAALDVLAERKDWERLWEMAAREHVPAAAAAKYTAMQVNALLEDAGTEGHGKALEEAVGTLAAHGAPSATAGAALYAKLVKTLLASTKKQEAEFDYAATVTALRDVMYGVMQATDSADEEFERLLMMVHYTHMHFTCAAEGGALTDLAVKAAVTLLRYSDTIPVDKLFYTAGSMCQKQGHENLGFVLLNRYVDLTEAIDEGDASLIDNSDFVDVEHIATVTEQTLPRQQYISAEDEREEARDWVLSVCMDAKIEQQLPPGDQAQGTIYAGLYSSDLPACIVTGYPVQSWEKVDVEGFVANKQDWNAYVRKKKVDPWSGTAQVPAF